jgi:hypothetical protein
MLGNLSLVDALLNDKEAAISEAKRAIEMLPIAKDAVDGPGMLPQPEGKQTIPRTQTGP